MFQWQWLEDAIARKLLPSDADQFNSLHERLIEGWRAIGKGRLLHLSGTLDVPEDEGTLAYLADCAHQAGLATVMIDMATIGRTPHGLFVDAKNVPLDLLFKLYPWEWMMREAFGRYLAGAPTQFVEPPWKAILSNKGILPLLVGDVSRPSQSAAGLFRRRRESRRAWRLLRAQAALLARGRQYRAGACRQQRVDRDSGPYGAEGFVRQALAPLPQFDGHHVVLGSWIAAGQPCGLSVREDASPITKNSSRFVPHAIVA